MERKTTIYDIAKALNITAATVSRALNNNPRISKATRELVMETAARMNYKPNKLALALKRGTSYNVGVIVPYINRNFFASVIRGIEDELYPHGYQVIICQTHAEERKEVEIINSLLNAHVGGILISLSGNPKHTDHFTHVLQKNIPLIFFDRTLRLEGSSTVTINDFQGGYEATRHLIDQGCHRIAHLTVDQPATIYNKRLEGYRKALEEGGLKYDPTYICSTSNDLNSGRKALAKLISLHLSPDAIYAASDFLALGAIQEAKDRGIRIPEDLCVVGFSNEPFTKFMELSISTVDQSPVDMGQMAAKVFLEKVNTILIHKPDKQVVLPSKLIIRKSSARH